MRALLKAMLPDRTVALPILLGPFRGARVQQNPRHALRMMLGLFEHELNHWLKLVLPRVNLVLDVGANAGYFSLGCAAGFHRLGKTGEIFAFEPDPMAFENLERGTRESTCEDIRIHISQCYVGSRERPNVTTLDAVSDQRSSQPRSENALIKIDVEGDELEVIYGASQWLNPANYFLIEVHHESFLRTLTEHFSDRGLKLNQVNQRPLPIIGYEVRSRANWWLVSELSGSAEPDPND